MLELTAAIKKIEELVISRDSMNNTLCSIATVIACAIEKMNLEVEFEREKYVSDI